MSKRSPEDDDVLSPDEIVAAVTKQLEESGQSLFDFLGLPPEPQDDGRPQLTALEWMQAPELVASRKRAVEIAEEAVAQLGKQADQLHRSWGETVRLVFEARREKRRQDSARGGRNKQKQCPAVFAFLKRRIAELEEAGETPSCTALLGEIPTSDMFIRWHREGETLIWHDPEDGRVKEYRYERGPDKLPAEVGRIKVSTFRDYFTDARAALQRRTAASGPINI